MATTDNPVSQPAETPGKARKRMRVFRKSEARDAQEHMPSIGIDEGVQAGLGKLMAATGAYPVTSGAKAELLFSEPGDAGMSLAYAWFKSGFILPRHSHNCDCLYYVIGGALVLGTQTLRKGDGVFIPANMAYTYEAGPDGVEILEFRNATRFHLMFQGNDEAHWDRIAHVMKENNPRWQNESPPTGE